MKQGLQDFLETFEDVNKTVIMLFLLGLSSFFRVKGYITPDGFVELIKTTTVSYFGTASVVHIGTVIKDHLANKLETLKGQNASIADQVHEK